MLEEKIDVGDTDEQATEIDLDELVGKECDVLGKNTKAKNGLTYSNVEHIVKTFDTDSHCLMD